MGVAAYANVLNSKVTPQSEAIPGKDQVQNSAGGFVFKIDDWARLERFLILGSEGGTYYTSERTLTKDNAQAVLRCVEADGPRAVDTIAAISLAGRAPKNDPAIFALAIAASYGNAETKQAAFAALPKVCRIGTHLFHFAQYVDGMRGWGRGLRRAVAAWYQQKATGSLANQLVKYQQRDGWSHRDLLRLSHPKPASDDQQTLYHWATRGWDGVGEDPHPNPSLQLVWAYERAKRATSDDEVAGLITTYGLTHEMVPTQFKTSATVWRALLAEMPITALIRNLPTLTRLGLIGPKKDAENGRVIENLLDKDRLIKGRVHPISVLMAQRTYSSGKSLKGSSTWDPYHKVVDALNDAFYLSFGAVTPTGKRTLLALDVSGSMGSLISGTSLTCREASAAMALVTANVEDHYTVVGFTAGSRGGYRDTSLTVLPISARQRLDDVIKTISGLPFGATDCALPILGALQRKEEYEAIAVYTDNETWAGSMHPSQALQKYRAEMKVDARLAVVGMTATSFSIADPSDAGMLDVVGFDTATPQVMSDFFSR